jgi:5'-hydroxyaverantin dehydrogenase
MSKVVQRHPVHWKALKDRSVIITGGASGLGEATVEKFAAHGAFVTIADVAVERGQQLAARLASEGKHVIFVECDTTDWESSVSAFKQAVNHGPSKTIDIALLFAGLSGPVGSMVDKVVQSEQPTLDSDPVRPTPPDAIEVNLKGVWLSTWLALHYFRLPAADGSDRKKSLVIVTSLAACRSVDPARGYYLSNFRP